MCRMISRCGVCLCPVSSSLYRHWKFFYLRTTGNVNMSNLSQVFGKFTTALLLILLAEHISSVDGALALALRKTVTETTISSGTSSVAVTTLSTITDVSSHSQPNKTTGLNENSTIITPSGTELLSENHQSNGIFKNTNAVLRAVYVACGIVIIIIIYNLVMTRLRRKKSKAQQYGILKAASDVEMTPLGQDDDEETTMFDVNMYKSNSRS